MPLLPVLRLALIGVALALHVSAIVAHSKPLVIAIGAAPIVWLLLEAIWHLARGKSRP